MASTFGHLFRITTWGESHGGGVGVVVDGCPPRLKLTEADIQPDLDRRRPGQSKIVSPRKESDTVQILSGTFVGKTLGTPICLWVKNEDARSEAYAEMKTKFRPSHADFTYFAKYGIRNWQGGGRASARETVGRVAAGAIAKKILREKFGVEILAYVKQVQKISAEINPDKVKFSEVESNIVRCPDKPAAEKMIRLIEKMRRAGDTVGGIFEVVATGVPIGLGSHVHWDRRLDSALAGAITSIPIVKGVEFGLGFEQTRRFGSAVQDVIEGRDPAGAWLRRTNNAGGLEGGMSNGQPIVIRGAVKPISTLPRPLASADLVTGRPVEKAHYERSDISVVPATGVVAEAMACLTLADFALEKFGGDSLAETLDNAARYLGRVARPNTAPSGMQVESPVAEERE